MLDCERKYGKLISMFYHGVKLKHSPSNERMREAIGCGNDVQSKHLAAL